MCHILIGVYPTITTMFHFVSGGYDCGNNNPWTATNRAQEKYFKHSNKRMHVRCDDFGRCWEMHCAPGREMHCAPGREMHCAPGREMHCAPGREMHCAPGREMHCAPGREMHCAPGREMHCAPGREMHCAPGREMHCAPGTRFQQSISVCA